MMIQFHTMFKLFAKKSLGQNFLINPGVVQKIISAAELKEDDTIVEVGPGTGVLTAALAEQARRVVAIEKDHRLIEDLKKQFTDKNIEIVEADILEFDPRSYKLEPKSYKVVANLPYYITSHFIRTVFEEWPRPKLLVLMVQKEVAQRIIATPPHMNLLALSVQYFSHPEIVATVSAGSFRPIPAVDSAVIKLVPHEKLPLSDPCREKLFLIWKTVFAGKRKQLINTLSLALDLERTKTEELLRLSNIAPKARPETLTLADWIRLFDNIEI